MVVANALPSGLAVSAPPAARVHIPPEAIRDYLLGNPLFAGWTGDVLLPLCKTMTGLEAGPKSLLIAAGNVVDGVGMILSGRASVDVPFSGGGSFTIDVLNPGATFGSAGLLSSSLSPVNIVADEPTKALWLPADVVATLMAAAPRFAERLCRELAGQLVRVCALPRSGASADVGRAPPASVADAMDLLAGKGSGPQPASNSGSNSGSNSASNSASTTGSLATPAPLAPGQIPFVDVVEADINATIASLLPGRIIRGQRVLPLRLHDNVLTIACVAPKNGAAIEAVRALYPQCRLDVCACAADDFEKVCARLRLDDHRGADARAKERGQRGVVTPDSLAYEDPAAERDIQTRAGNDESVKLVNKILAAALDRDASDIHIEPLGARTIVRFRVDGHVVDWAENIPVSASRLISGRLKVLAGMDITERKLPQEGRISLQAGAQKREIELRVTTLPLRVGEKIALHVQDAGATVRAIDRIVTDARGLDLLRRALLLPGGVVLVAGEHGSGATSTLYSLIAEKRRTAPGAHVVCVEDAVDLKVPGITQIGVNPALGFGGTLQAVLKQDPDVVVAGDVRDAVSAMVLLEAGLAGRTVLASVRADGAIAALQRLHALDVPLSKIGQAVSAVVSQRLARRLCTCAVGEPPPKVLFDALVSKRLLEPGRPPNVGRPVGCDVCGGSGVVGRTAVSEVLFMTDDVRAAFALGSSKAEMERAAGKALVPFGAAAASLLLQRVIAPAEALLMSS